MTDIPKRMELVLDRPRAIFYDFRVGNEWEKETYKRDLAERKENELPLEGFEKRRITSFQLGWTSDLTTVLWVMLRRADPELTYDATAELVDLNNVITVQDGVAEIMGIQVQRKPLSAVADPENKPATQEVEAKN